MEELPTPESVPTKQKIIEKLKTEGLTFEMKNLVSKWYESKEKEIITRKEQILFELDKIDFYYTVDDLKGAFDIARDAYEIARYEGEEDLVEKILEIFPELE